MKTVKLSSRNVVYPVTSELDLWLCYSLHANRSTLPLPCSAIRTFLLHVRLSSKQSRHQSSVNQMKENDRNIQQSPIVAVVYSFNGKKGCQTATYLQKETTDTTERQHFTVHLINRHNYKPTNSQELKFQFIYLIIKINCIKTIHNFYKFKLKNIEWRH